MQLFLQRSNTFRYTTSLVDLHDHYVHLVVYFVCVEEQGFSDDIHSV